MDYKLATYNHFTDAFIYMFNNLKLNKMNYEITEEQIKELAKGNAKVKNWFPEVFETKLEVGKWYKSDYPLLINIQEIHHHKLVAYGFNSDNDFLQPQDFCSTNNEEIKDNDYSADSWLELCTKYLNNAFSAREVIESGEFQEKRDLILDVGQNLILKDRKLNFSFKAPYDVLLKPEYRTDVLGLVNYVGTYYREHLYAYAN